MTWSYKVGDTVRDIYTKRKGKIISVDEYYDNGDGTKSNTLITDGRNYLVCYPPTTEQEWVDQGDSWEYSHPKDLTIVEELNEEGEINEGRKLQS